ncbi:MAG TPA: hypothetical protein VG389_18810 [Myxococcota bacterium]|jgi:hypothetical protein|nr:hypothetical protein [Myxococcota bacterium]
MLGTRLFPLLVVFSAHALLGCGGGSAPATTSAPAPAAPAVPPVAGTYAGTLAVYPDYDPGYLEFHEPPADAKHVDVPATLELRDPKRGAGAWVMTLFLRAGDVVWTMETVVLEKPDHLELQATRPLRCAALETAGRVFAEIRGDALVLKELTPEKRCPMAGTETRFVTFRGTRTALAARPH